MKSNSDYVCACRQPQYGWLVQQSHDEHEPLVIAPEWWECVESELEFVRGESESEHEFEGERFLCAVPQGLADMSVSS